MVLTGWLEHVEASALRVNGDVTAPAPGLLTVGLAKAAGRASAQSAGTSKVRILIITVQS